MSVTKDLETKTWTSQLWYKDFTGKRKHTTKRGFATKKEAEKWEREFLCSDRPTDITIGDISKRYEKDMDMKFTTGELQDSTIINKKNFVRYYILPYFDKTIATNITTNDVNEWIDHLIKNHKTLRGDRPSSGTIKTAKQILSQIFDYGIKNMGLKNNPVTNANKIGFYSTDKRSIWTAEQFLQFHNAMERYPAVKTVFDIIYASGLRLGEVLALTPNDITPFKISIVKGLVRLPLKGSRLHKPKTKSSTRDVEIPRGLYFQIQEYINSIDGIRPTDRMFKITDQYCRWCMETVENELGLPHSSPHMLRHLYASTIYAATKDLTIIASQLGHASIDVTAKVYVDMIKGNDRQAVDDLEHILTIK